MSLIDGLVLLGLAVLVGWRGFLRSRAPAWRGRALIGVLALAGLQLVIAGPAWQFIPADLCLLWLGLLGLPVLRTSPPRVVRVLTGVGLLLAASASFGVWSFLRAPRLTP